MSEPSNAEWNAFNRNLNWIRQHGTKQNKEFLKGTGPSGESSNLTKRQTQQRRADIRRNPKKYD